jgi:hypothetical protein
MPLVVGVHGIGQQLMGEQTLLMDWLPAVQDGLSRAGGPALDDHDMAMSFYGDLFRPPGELLAVGGPRYTADDVAAGLEQDLLLAWWQAAAEADDRVVPPDAPDTLVRAPRTVQIALRALCGYRFFSDLALRAMVFNLKQVSAYLTEPGVRSEVQERVARLIGDDTRVVVAHSLGSVIAYEALCALPGHCVRALVTLGSPLGIPMIFDRLLPEPGRWPGGEDLVWTNVADVGDVVALVKDLRPQFGPRVRGAVVHNGSRAHDARPYLADALTGSAVSEGLCGL